MRSPMWKQCQRCGWVMNRRSLRRPFLTCHESYDASSHGSSRRRTLGAYSGLIVVVRLGVYGHGAANELELRLELVARVAKGEMEPQRGAVGNAQPAVEAGRDQPARLLAVEFHASAAACGPANQRFSRHSRKDMRAR